MMLAVYAKKSEIDKGKLWYYDKHWYVIKTRLTLRIWGVFSYACEEIHLFSIVIFYY